MSLAQAFVRSADQHAEKPAIYHGEAEFTYARVASQARWLASELRGRLGVAPGDRVGIWIKNCPEYVAAYFGIFMAGAVAVPINNFLKPDEVAYMLSDGGIDVLITDAATKEAAGVLAAARPGLKTLDAEEIARAQDHPAPFEIAPRRLEDLAVIIYTSGTTGRPKGAMLSHGNLLHNVESCRRVLEAVDFDRFAILLPMFHSFMMTVGILLPTLVGGSILVIKSLHPPKNIMMEIMQRQATILPAIPQFFRAMAAAPPPPGFPLRLCISGAAPLPMEVIKEFTSKYPIPLIEGYGLSEASPVVALNPIHGPIRPGTIGVPVHDVEVSIQDESGNILGPGDIGELCVRGGNVMLGYWNKPEETERAIRDGWLLTGDVGFKEEDGYISITDRKKDMLLVNGINVYPREIEEVMYQFPGVKEAAVVSRLDARKGEQPVAFVVFDEGRQVDGRELVAFLRQKLADYKVPREVNTLPALPRNATGKILKTTLRDIARSQPSSAPPQEET